MDKKYLDYITEKIIGCAFEVSNTLGAGFLEKVYQNAMVIELRDNDLQIVKEKPITIYYKNQIVGEYFPDIMVNNQIILEIKADRKSTRLNSSHVAISYAVFCLKKKKKE